MTTVTVHEAETQILDLIARVSEGEEIAIVENGVIIAKISPIENKPKRRGFGIDKGKFEIPPEFDDPIPEFDL